MISRKRICALCLMLSLLFVGCNRTYDYSFMQSLDCVTKVEICSYDYSSNAITSLVVLDTSKAKALLAEIDLLECKKHFGDHTMDYGEVIIYISYSDDTAEVIGLWNVARVNKDGQWSIGSEYFDAGQMCSLILAYADKELLPDLSEYLVEK